MKDVLVINSYCGSLVLGAMATGVPIRASMEDSGYGIACQKLNFPHLRYVDRLPWPSDHLGDSVVIAHPPCAAFSNMNIVKEKRGLETDAFECHKRVMEYSFTRGCEALAIESVPGALEAAGPTYANYAEENGYDHCFIMLNAVDFGVPQWRPRFWVLFFRKDLGIPFYRFRYHPRYRNVESILTGAPATDPVTLKHVGYLKKKYDAAGFDFDGMMASDQVQPGGFDKLARQFFANKDLTPEQVKEATGTKGLYRAGLPRKLDPTLWAPVILGFSLWYVNDRPLNQIEYQRIMGFPDDWKWPVKEGKDFLTYLSKGVCPPVATWIIEQIGLNLSPLTCEFTHSCEKGQTLDLQPQKAEVEPLIWQGTYEVLNKTTLERSYHAKMVPEVQAVDKGPLQEPEGMPDLQGGPADDGATQGEGVGPKAFAAMTLFSERPQDGDTFVYQDRTLTLLSRLSPIEAQITSGTVNLDGNVRDELADRIELPSMGEQVTEKLGSLLPPTLPSVEPLKAQSGPGLGLPLEGSNSSSLADRAERWKR